MADKLDIRRTSLSLGTLFAVLHTAGVLLIQSPGVVAFWQQMHFLSVGYTVQPFNPTTLVLGILTAFVSGAVIGWLFVKTYERMKGK